MEEKDFLQEIKEIEMIKEAIGLLEWDAQTGMPEAASDFRGEVSGYLAGQAFSRSIGPKIKEAITTLKPENLSEVGQEVLTFVKEEYDLNKAIPADRYEAFMKETSKAHTAWAKARASQNFDDFKGSLSAIISYLKEFIPLWQKDEATAYDVLLNQYEPGMTVEKLDAIFGEVKDGIMALRARLAEGTAPQTDFLSRKVTKAQQKRFAETVVKELGYDFERGRLDDTIHPFMLDLNRNDARITTRWNEHDFSMAIFGIMHEAGHGMYEQNIDPKYDHTPLSTGTSMGIHESQSLFNEIIIGSNQAFWRKQYPFFQECTEGTFDDIDFDTFYRGLKQTRASLIRIEADSLTYPLHIIIRYELEKEIFNGDVTVEELPTRWNDKYEEYLGIRPENDLEGILQDVHWSGGSFGYFPSYALGYMYAAQLLHAMEETVDVDAVLASQDYSPIKNWLTEHIHRYGASKKPNWLIQEATGEALNPQYLLDYLKKVYYTAYQIND